MMKIKNSYLLFTIPSLVTVAAVLLYPLGYAFYLSFFKYSLGSTPRFVGLENYRSVFIRSDFLHSLGVSASFTGIVVSAQFVLGLILAMLLDKIKVGRKIYLTVIFLPAMVTPAAAGMVLKWMFIPTWGVVNYFLKSTLHIAPPNWFDVPSYALLAVIIAEIWQFTPFVTIITFAGLQSIPQESIEAGIIDGAHGLQMFWYIILPILKPIILFVIMIRTMDAWRLFDRIFVMTGGGPGTATETLTLYNYRLAFRLLRMGEGSTVGVYTLLFLIAIIGLYLYLLYEKEQ